MKYKRNFITLSLILGAVFLFLSSIRGVWGQENLIEDLSNTVKEKEEVESVQQVEQISESEKKVLNQYFDIHLIRGGQSAFTGNVYYTVLITPHLDSPRTQIQWSYPAALKIKPRHKEFMAMKAGETYTIKATIKPERGGVYPFTISAISWQHDTNYTNSASDDITFNDSLVLQPISQSYTLGNIAKFLIIFLVAGGAIFAAIKLIPKYSSKAKKWLTPPV